ncbi:MAG TPA: NAD(P)H-binding protein [Anaeromyxobacteraceae bacterium]|nr:NAD(P)H-binding protein [Anaeromyxobacteraceae bacterium]
MNLLVIGASQGTGALCVRRAIAQGHRVTAFARHPEKLEFEDPLLRKVVGDFHQEASVRGVVPGHDAVIITASATRLGAFRENPRYYSQGTAFVVDEMRASGPRRLVVLSALGVGDSRVVLNPVARLLLAGWLLRVPFADHEVQERLVRESGLDWVIARPSRLTHGPARGRYVKETSVKSIPSAISREDLAEFLVEACAKSTWVGQTVLLGG